MTDTTAVRIEPRHLSMYGEGEVEVHWRETMDLRMVLAQKRTFCPGELGTILIALNVDGEGFDVVNTEWEPRRSEGPIDEIAGLNRAILALEITRDALIRTRS